MKEDKALIASICADALTIARKKFGQFGKTATIVLEDYQTIIVTLHKRRKPYETETITIKVTQHYR